MYYSSGYYSSGVYMYRSLYRRPSQSGIIICVPTYRLEPAIARRNSASLLGNALMAIAGSDAAEPWSWNNGHDEC